LDPVSGNAPQASGVAAVGPTRDTRIRLGAAAILVLLLAELLLGNQLAVVGSPYPVGYLAAHVVLSILLIGLTAHVLVRSSRLPSRPAKAIAGLTFLSAVGATIGGTVFLLGGGSSIALYAMEGLGGLAVLGAILLIVLGSVEIPAKPETP
jgi:hypothetical protein